MAPQLKISEINGLGKYFRESKYWLFISHLMSQAFHGESIYLWGGAVRDGILSLRGENVAEDGDLDVIVDSDIRNKFFGARNVYRNRHGGIKWEPEQGIEIDITTHHNQHLAKKGILLRWKQV